MDKLSVILITRNEQANIERCLKSILPIADEIVVVDSGSTDATQYICSKYSVRWHSCEWKGFGEQKNYANSLATYDYVFSIDADEELSPQLCESIRTAKIEGFSGIYSMNRLARYANRWIRHCGWYPDTKIRIWNRHIGSWHGFVHEQLQFNSTQQERLLQGDLLHYSYSNIADHIARANTYTSLVAQQYFERGKRTNPLKMIFAALFGFVRDYIFRQGFRDGIQGLIICSIAAFSTFLKYAKLWELQRNQ